jgi:hypothetical protein
MMWKRDWGASTSKEKWRGTCEKWWRYDPIIVKTIKPEYLYNRSTISYDPRGDLVALSNASKTRTTR